MSTTTRRRNITGDPDEPAWVREPTPPDPVHSIPPPWVVRNASPESVEESRLRLQEILLQAATPDPNAAPDDQERASIPVQYHATRFRARGLSEGAALMQAMALVARADHAADCPICQQHPDVGLSIRARRAESERMARQGAALLDRHALADEIRRLQARQAHQAKHPPRHTEVTL